MTESERLRAQAARCLRLARQTTDETIAKRLLDLAADSQEQAEKIDREANKLACLRWAAGCCI
jgi:hypothetical protein